MNQDRISIETNLPPLPLSEGISSKYITVNDLIVHFLDAPPADMHPGGSEPPLIILVHGFPELAYSWRKIMCPLSDLGFRVIAADQRGFGRTVPNPNVAESDQTYPYTYKGSLAPFSFTNLARDVVSFVYALGYDSVSCIMGHDSGSITASSCALVRPDLFRSVVLMSAPFVGVSGSPYDIPVYSSLSDAIAADAPPKAPHMGLTMNSMLAGLNPPKIYYQHYYSLPQANVQMHDELSPNELHNFIRAYFHVKSACWPDSSSSSDDIEKYSIPRLLTGLEEVAQLPPYYMMPRGPSMPTVVGAYHPREKDLERSRSWLSETDVGAYASEYGRTGFQGGLNRYRVATQLGRVADTPNSISTSEEDHVSELTLFVGKKIEVPALFVAGEKDWGPFQYPGALEKMRNACPSMKERSEGIVFIKNAGHWVQQENPDELFEALKRFLSGLRSR